MAKELLLSFVDEGISVRAVLFEEQAPKTCKTICEHLPYIGTLGHAKFSGTLVAFYIDSAIVIEKENATRLLQIGDLCYTHYPQRTRHGYPEALSEIYWPYDRYANPTAPGSLEPVYPNIFGRIVGETEAFYAVCRRIAEEGRKRFEIRAG
jgi:hypothetical protein